MVHPVRFERTTAWFVAKYSIQLSYGCIKLLLVAAIKNNGGEGGIRTLDTRLTYTPLAGERLQPLGHLSVFAAKHYLFNNVFATYKKINSCKMVHPVRFERTTAWFVAKYSIQLSYGCIKTFSKQKELQCNAIPFLKMVHPVRFERTTAWFVAKYSIQLSYGCIKTLFKTKGIAMQFLF